MKNIWSWIGIVILVALLGWAGYYGWQQRGMLENLRNQIANNTVLNNPNSTKYVVPAGYVTYTNTKYGFKLDYQKPTSFPGISFLSFSDTPGNITSTSSNSEFLASGAIDMSKEDGRMHFIYVWKEKNLDQTAYVFKKDLSEAQMPYSESRITRNGLELVVLKFQQGYENSILDVEERIAKLASGYVVIVGSVGSLKLNPDQKFLDSLRNI